MDLHNIMSAFQLCLELWKVVLSTDCWSECYVKPEYKEIR